MHIGVFTTFLYNNSTDNYNPENQTNILIPNNQPITITEPFMVSSSNLVLQFGKKEQIANKYEANFSNDSLCFFKGSISCPSLTDLTTLISHASLTGYLPHAHEITPTLLQQNNYNKNTTMMARWDSKTTNIKLPTNDIRIKQQSTVLHPVSGAAVSIIRESIAIQLGTPIFLLKDPIEVLDINDGTANFSKVCYVQLEVTGVELFRAVILCVTKKDSFMPFLLGNDDQAAFNIAPQPDTREIRLGPAQKPYGSIKFLHPLEWKKSLNSRMHSQLKDSLAEENKDLLKKVKLAKSSGLTTPNIQILSHSGMFQQRAKKQNKTITNITSEEIRQASRIAPTPQSPQEAATHALDHQVQLLLESGKLISFERKNDHWRDSQGVKALNAAKLNSDSTDSKSH